MISVQADYRAHEGHRSELIAFRGARAAPTPVELRQASASDALALQLLLAQLDNETPYLGFLPGERSFQDGEVQRRILDDPTGKQGAFFLAYAGKELAGFVQGQINPLCQYRHILDIEIGIRQQFAGQGIGKRLLASLETWALDRHARRLELVVAANNGRALNLYTRCGFRTSLPKTSR